MSPLTTINVMSRSVQVVMAVRDEDHHILLDPILSLHLVFDAALQGFSTIAGAGQATAGSAASALTETPRLVLTRCCRINLILLSVYAEFASLLYCRVKPSVWLTKVCVAGTLLDRPHVFPFHVVLGLILETYVAIRNIVPKQTPECIPYRSGRLVDNIVPLAQ